MIHQHSTAVGRHAEAKVESADTWTMSFDTPVIHTHTPIFIYMHTYTLYILYYIYICTYLHFALIQRNYYRPPSAIMKPLFKMYPDLRNIFFLPFSSIFIFQCQLTTGRLKTPLRQDADRVLVSYEKSLIKDELPPEEVRARQVTLRNDELLSKLDPLKKAQTARVLVVVGHGWTFPT